MIGRATRTLYVLLSMAIVIAAAGRAPSRAFRAVRERWRSDRLAGDAPSAAFASVRDARDRVETRGRTQTVVAIVRRKSEVTIRACVGGRRAAGCLALTQIVVDNALPVHVALLKERFRKQPHFLSTSTLFKTDHLCEICHMGTSKGTRAFGAIPTAVQSPPERQSDAVTSRMANFQATYCFQQSSIVPVKIAEVRSCTSGSG